MLSSPIFLIRHAETVLNAARIVQHPDTPLSARGRRQAQRLAEHLRDLGVTHVASSDYLRARKTAETICQVASAGLTLDPILRERHLGNLRGRSYAEVGSQIFSETGEPVGGESWVTFQLRIDAIWRWIRALRARQAGLLAVVTHGLVCRALVTRHLEVVGAAPLRFDNASITVIDPGPTWHVRPLASADHLDPADAPTPHLRSQ